LSSAIITIESAATSKFVRHRPAFNVLTKPIGPICNLDCTYCYYLEKEKLYGSKERYRMADDLLESYIRQYIEGQAIPEIHMAWQGGEPTLLGVDFFRRVVEIQKTFANGKQITNALQTNGTLLDDKWGEFLKKNNFLIGISIDGPAELHDKYRLDKQQRPTFNAVMRGIEILKKYAVDFNTLTVVNSANQDHPLKVYDFLKGIGSRHLQFIPLVERLPDHAAKTLGLDHALPPDGDDLGVEKVTHWSVGASKYGEFLNAIFDYWVRRDVGRIFVQLFDITLSKMVSGTGGLCIFEETCGASLAIEHNGDLYSCDHYVYPQYRLGNINETPLADLVGSEQQYKFGDDKRDTLPGYCRQCEVRYACNGDCPKHRFAVTPDGEPGLSYLCPSYKAFFTHTMPYFDAMAQAIAGRRAPAEIMSLVLEADMRTAAELEARKLQTKWKTAGRNSPCPCGSGKKFKHCCLK
jgi:uncharacterized protein